MNRLILLISAVSAQEKGMKVAVYSLHLACKLPSERLPTSKAHGQGYALPHVVLGRQELGLSVLILLKPVFRISEKDVGIFQFPAHGFRQYVPLRKYWEHLKQYGVSKVSVPSSLKKLECLGNELHLPYAPRPKLHVVAHTLPAGFRLDHGLHLAKCLKGAVVQISPEDKRAQPVKKLPSCLNIPGNRPGLDPGIPLPVPALALVIGLHCIKTYAQGTTVAPGAKPGIHPEHQAVRAGRADYRDEPAA